MLGEGDDAQVEPPTWEQVAPEPEPEAEAEATIEAAPDAPAPVDERAARAAPPAPARPRVSGADMVIYVLASVVFAVSMLGLIWLMRGS